MDDFQLGKGIGYGIGAAIAAILGWLGLRTRRRHALELGLEDRRGGELGRRELDGMQDRVRDVESRVSRLEGEMVNVTRQADRLERDAIAYRQEMRDAIADINVKLDQLLGWTRPRGE